MGNKVRILSLLLVCALAAGLTAGCSQSGGGNASEDEITKIQMMLPLYESLPDENNTWWTEYKKLARVELEIEWVPSADYREKLNLMLSTGDLPEVSVAWMEPAIYKAYQRGQFWQLNDFFGDWSRYPNLKNNMPENAWQMLRIDGKNYGVPRSRPHVDQSIHIRGDLYDKAGIPYPKTVEEYRDSVRAVMDSTGQSDMLGLTGYNYDVFFVMLMAPFGALDDQFDENGGLIYYKLTDNYADYIEYLRSLYEVGVLPKEYLTTNGTQNSEIFTSGKSVSIIDNYWRDYTYTEQLKNVDPDAVCISIEPLIGPKGQKAMINSGLASGELVISHKVPEEKVYKILDYFERTSTPEVLDIVYYGFEGIHHEGKVLTELGKVEVGMSCQQPLALHKNEWAKVFYPGAPPEWNEKHIEESAIAWEVGVMEKFSLLVSESWADNWPKHKQSFEGIEAQAVAGEISMDEYRKFVSDLRSDPGMRQCFQEFTASNKEKFGA